METIQFQGTVERTPGVFEECPEYVTFDLRATEGNRLEVFLPAKQSPNYRIGQRLCLSGGEQQVEPGVDGPGDYIRYWPEAVRAVEQSGA